MEIKKRRSLASQLILIGGGFTAIGLIGTCYMCDGFLPMLDLFKFMLAYCRDLKAWLELLSFPAAFLSGLALFPWGNRRDASTPAEAGTLPENTWLPSPTNGAS